MKILPVSLLILLVTFFTTYTVYAQDSHPDSVKVKLDDIRLDEPTPIPVTTSSDSVLYGTDADEFEKHGYILHHGFPFSSAPADISFGFSQTRMGFEPPSPDYTDEKNINISINADQPYSYEVLLAQQKILTSGGSTIHNTLCDQHPVPCTSTYARIWNSNSAYGFGYRIAGDDTPLDFHVSNTYRSFPLISNNEDPLPILQNMNTSTNHQAQLFFKINIPPSYEQGTYSTDVSIIFLPKL